MKLPLLTTCLLVLLLTYTCDAACMYGHGAYMLPAGLHSHVHVYIPDSHYLSTILWDPSYHFYSPSDYLLYLGLCNCLFTLVLCIPCCNSVPCLKNTGLVPVHLCYLHSVNTPHCPAYTTTLLYRFCLLPLLWY